MAVKENDDDAGTRNVESVRDMEEDPTFAISLVLPIDASEACAVAFAFSRRHVPKPGVHAFIGEGRGVEFGERRLGPDRNLDARLNLNGLYAVRCFVPIFRDGTLRTFERRQCQQCREENSGS
ncbi:MAG TPA: hypothetical protein VMH84_05770 [Xanthobacteraceae bacterium]|nr:hypothetical protein [Xanthobacteraceae bacterium]